MHLSDLYRAASMAAMLVVCIGSSPVGGREALRTASTLDGVTLVTLGKLPRGPASARLMTDLCSRYLVQPRTSGGRTARALGWAVTGEARLGPFTAVSFAGSLEPATSGTCSVRDGNVGIFDADGAILALAFAVRGSRRTIGKVEPLEGGAVRIWDGEPGGLPIADIERTEGDQLRLGALAPQESLCNGQSVVPNIYGQPINEARKLLWARGWAPVPTQPPPDKASREGELVRRGVPEAEGCSGTGFGYCSYNYRGGGGRLNVTSIGDSDFPTVSGYAVTCP